MKPGLAEDKMLYITDRGQWRDWLKKNYRSQREIWLVYYKKHTGKPRIAYNDAVEEALCFGWIDSTVKRLDEERFAQRFSLGNPKRPYSQANKERLRGLIKQGKVAEDVLATLGDMLTEALDVAPDILQAIKANEKAWENFQKFSDSYIRIRVGFIEAARNRPQEFEKRLRHFIAMTAKNKQFGFGGVEKYY
jgi:uncharacterized protein YdeI (YjbR/CyaY-like superfamily)